MDVIDEIRAFSSDEDKPVLFWLFHRYHMQSQWSFVAKCDFQRYGDQSYQVYRIWRPTEEGRVLYTYATNRYLVIIDIDTFGGITEREVTFCSSMLLVSNMVRDVDPGYSGDLLGEFSVIDRFQNAYKFYVVEMP